ncbi:MAG: DUF3892 domain-containing protein [Thermoplasmata archaeon]|nr:MAG: DUF3892 domain-containing protein [Thermoplasmata archaeon]
MTDKWADYLISAVKYNEKKYHIIKVRSHEDIGDKVGPSFEESRKTVVSNLKKGKTYCTIIMKEKWTKGAPIKIVQINGKEFIKTYSNNKEEDNLGELQEL